MSDFVIKTWFGTYLFFRKDDSRLCHGDAASIGGQLVLVKGEALADGENLLYLAENTCVPLVLEEVQLKTIDVEPGRVAIKGRGFVSALPDGGIATDRQEIHGWELFEFVKVDCRSILQSTSRSLFSSCRSKNSIPKAIHQIDLRRPGEPSFALGRSGRNGKYFEEIDRNYSYTLWTNKEIYDAINDWFGYAVLEAYLRINPRYGAARADFFRYLCIYQNGGIYLDLKAGITGSVDKILNHDDSYLLSFWGASVPSHVGRHEELTTRFGHGEFNQWFVIGSVGHPILEAVINEVLRRIHAYNRQSFGVGSMGVFRTTGPIAYTIGVKSVIEWHPHRIFDAEASGLIYDRTGRHNMGDKYHYSQILDDVIL